MFNNIKYDLEAHTVNLLNLQMLLLNRFIIHYIKVYLKIINKLRNIQNLEIVEFQNVIHILEILVVSS